MQDTATVVDAMETAVAIVDAGGRVVVANDAWERLAEWLETPVPAGSGDAFDSASGPLSDEFRATLKDVSSDSGSESQTVHYNVPSTQRVLKFRLYPLEENGASEVLVVNEGDSIDRDRLVDLRLKERTLDRAPVGITIAGQTTEDGDNPLIYVNEAFEDITGHSREEVVGRDCRFLQGPETDPESVQQMAEAIESDEQISLVLRNYTKNDEPFWNDVTIAPLKNDVGEVTHFVGFQTDVSERVGAKRSLETERDRLSMLNQVVRHDIRNDMAIIEGWADQLESHVAPEGEEQFERILDAAKHTKQLTSAVRDISTVITEDEPDLEPIDLGPILKEEVRQCRSRFSYLDEELTVEYEPPQDDITVWGTSLLRSVFTNLLNNAVYHNDKDKVHIDVSVTTEEDSVVVSVADNGPGIPDAQKKTVFGKGEQFLDSSGTGLGLFLVDSLVTIYGGAVWIEDNDPEGSIFRVELDPVQ